MQNSSNIENDLPTVVLTSIVGGVSTGRKLWCSTLEGLNPFNGPTLLEVAKKLPGGLRGAYTRADEPYKPGREAAWKKCIGAK
jgi:hypothetical protein